MAETRKLAEQTFAGRFESLSPCIAQSFSRLIIARRQPFVSGTLVVVECDFQKVATSPMLVLFTFLSNRRAPFALPTLWPMSIVRWR